jgi:hypothetical protein
MDISHLPFYMLLFQDEEPNWKGQNGEEESCPLFRTNHNRQPS